MREELLITTVNLILSEEKRVEDLVWSFPSLLLFVLGISLTVLEFTGRHPTSVRHLQPQKRNRSLGHDGYYKATITFS